MTQWRFIDELQLNEVNVPRAALHFSRAIAYPQLDVARYMGTLHEISEDAADAVELDAPVTAQARQLSDYLFNELGFRGNAADYHDPRNTYLNEVIDRRLGIPITLSAIYIDVAARLGIPAYGVSLPGHFIVGIRSGEKDLWLDPFHGGRFLDLTDCVDLIRLSSGYEGPIEAAWFAPAPARGILARMLGNLRANYVSAEAWEPAIRVIELLRQVQPAQAEHLRDLGLVFYHQHQLSKAAHYLNEYLLREPGASDAHVIRDGIGKMLDQWVPMN